MTGKATGETRREPGQRLERQISVILRVGGYSSGSIIALGVLLLLFTGESGYPQGTWPRSLRAILTGAALLKPYAVIQAGLLLLAATPVVRVVVSTAIFAAKRDYRYTALTLSVLAMLVAGLLLGNTAH